VEKLIERIRQALSHSLVVDSQELYITFSYGVSLFPSDVKTHDVLFTNAIASVNRAKQLGGNRVVFFSEEVLTSTEDRLKLRTDLRKALERKEFVLFYQPKIDLSTGKVSGCEALIRWKKRGKFIPPSKFLPLLEEGELIHEVGEWVVTEACTQLKTWKERGIDISVAVNVSPAQLKIPAFADRLLYSISSCGGLFENFEIEITESTIMEDTAMSVEFLNTLASYGIRTYIDDFGTGYSSLAYLKKLPVYALKIDREFVKDLPHDRDDLEIVKATVLLAKTFGLKTVAEGTETREQVELLRELGCNYAQGYYFAKPMPVKEFEEFLLSRGSN
jgi:EAL domain-containing protein (putative c-di-GMP-specific phosphodiesterase class I)